MVCSVMETGITIVYLEPVQSSHVLLPSDDSIDEMDRVKILDGTGILDTSRLDSNVRLSEIFEQLPASHLISKSNRTYSSNIRA
jgi:hypothetical protein